MTATQRAVRYDRVGGPEVLHVAQVPAPSADRGEAVVAVRAVGLNPFDAKVRAGMVPSAAPFPRGLGGDLAGSVTEVGVGATYGDGAPIAVGDEVLGWGASTLQERVAVTASQLVRKPVAVPFVVAGSLSTPGQTAVASLRTVEVGPGDTVLVGAAAGSVGFVYAQLAMHAGARVIGTASLANHERLRAVGVVPVEYGPGLAQRVRALAPEGVTAAQDNVGRETIDAALALEVAAERINTIVDYAAVEEFGVRTPGRYERNADVLADLVRRVAEGDLALPIQQEFTLDEVAAAFTLLEGRHLSGKVVVVP